LLIIAARNNPMRGNARRAELKELRGPDPPSDDLKQEKQRAANRLMYNQFSSRLTQHLEAQMGC